MESTDNLVDHLAKQNVNKYPARFVRRVHFSSGHRYAMPSASDEENQKTYGALFTPAGLGHNFILEGYFEGPIDPVTGMVVNLKAADMWLKEVTEPLDHHFLNEDVEFFKTHVPTAENIAKYCFENLQHRVKSSLSKVNLFKVRLYESDDFWVDYTDREDLEI